MRYNLMKMLLCEASRNGYKLLEYANDIENEANRL